MAGEARYYPPDGTSLPIFLDSGMIVPPSLWTTFVALLEGFGLALHQVDDPGGVVWAAAGPLYYRNEPSTDQFREVEAVTPGTGINDGDWDWVTPAAYFAFPGGDMAKATYDTDDDGSVNSAEGLKETAGPTVVPMGPVAADTVLTRNPAGTALVGEARSNFENAGTAAGLVAAHEGGLDPHAGVYQLKTEKDAVAGYAGLDAVGRTTAGVDTTDDLIVDAAAQGLVLKSPNGNYHRITVTNGGVLTVTDLGTTKP